jgi:hypothetical protein
MVTTGGIHRRGAETLRKQSQSQPKGAEAAEGAAAQGSRARAMLGRVGLSRLLGTLGLRGLRHPRALGFAFVLLSPCLCAFVVNIVLLSGGNRPGARIRG